MLKHIRDWLITILEAAALTIFLLVFVAQSFLVEGYSMEPTLENGEKVMVEKVSYRFRDPKRGEIIIIKNPLKRRDIYIKRVVGLPGDTIEVKNGQIFINGILLEEDYVLEPFNSWYSGTFFVPEGHVFVLGDNRNHSDDSRRIGPIPYGDVIGRVMFVYWPFDKFEFLEPPKALANLDQSFDN